jgi:acetyl-CoA decarbonylase/synthase complex subunit gamma
VRGELTGEQTDQNFVSGFVNTSVGQIPKVETKLSLSDRWGSFKARLGAGRMNYMVDPGLYAVGNPSEGSEVLVTSNYKLTFDSLRKELTGRDFWILVLDTEGVNVWCAAGKKTFGTEELVSRIKKVRLDEIVNHGRLIVPQLGAPGIAAHKVRELSGYRVVYGPIRSRDIARFIDNKRVATETMREKTFDTWERITLIPVELNFAIRIALLIIIVIGLIGGALGPESFMENLWRYWSMSAIWLIASILGGVVLTPTLLPWLPGRAFALKGIIPGLFTGSCAYYVTSILYPATGWRLEIIAWFILTVSASSFMAMNFTGASTYTSLSGVKAEMKWAAPAQFTGLLVAMTLWIGSLIRG